MSELVDLLTAAVDDALDTDRPVGLVVSGGIDSSTIACLALRQEPDLPAFTGYYAVPGFDERRYANLVPARERHAILITPDDVIEHFDAIMAVAPRPLQGPGMIGQYVVAYAVSAHGIETVLSGEGSDELFGGYARLMHVAGHPLPSTYPADYRPPADYPTTVAAALDYDLRNLPDLLAVDDAMCGAWGVEARAPFTDERVVEYALNLPPTLRVGKAHLRSRVRGIVPDPIIDRTDKLGFPIPLVHWAQGPLREWFMDRIGYIPDPADPWTRTYWYELCESTLERIGERH